MKWIPPALSILALADLAYEGNPALRKVLRTAEQLPEDVQGRIEACDRHAERS